MITKTNIDEGYAFDWGKTSSDYAVSLLLDSRVVACEDVLY